MVRQQTTSRFRSFAAAVLAAALVISQAVVIPPAVLADAGSLAITTTALPDGQVGQPYSAQLEVSGGTQPYTWSVVSGSLSDGLTLDASAGTIRGTPTAAGSYSFTVQVADSSSPANTATADLSIVVNPVAQAVDATQSTVTASPTSVPADGQTASTVTVTVKDASGAPVQGVQVTLDQGGGHSVITPVNATTDANGQATFQATDSTPETVTYTATAGGVQIVQTAQVTFTSQASQPAQLSILPPSAPSRWDGLPVLPDATAGQPYSVQLEASGGTPPYRWSTSRLPDGLAIDQATGVISGVPAHPASATVAIFVTDANGAEAILGADLPVYPMSITPASLPDATAGEVYNAQISVTGGAGFGAPRYYWSPASGLPEGLSLMQSNYGDTAFVSGLTCQPGTYQVSATVTDAAGHKETVQLPLTVQPSTTPSPAIGPDSLPDAVAGQLYSVQLSVANAPEPYIWSIASGPSWLSIDDNGILHGVPTDPGTVDVTVRVSAAEPCGTAEKTYTLTVQPAQGPAPLTIATGSLPDGQVGQHYAVQLEASGGTPPYSWNAFGLPAGLSLDPDTGELSGTPGFADTYQVTVTAEDAAYRTASKTFTLTIHQSAQSPSPPVVMLPYLPTGVVSQPYFAQLLAVGGQPPYTWQADGLPGGLSLSGDQITGTPAKAGDYQVILAVTDSAGATASQLVELRVIVMEQPQPAPAPAPTPTPAPAPAPTGPVEKQVPVQPGTPVGPGLETAGDGIYVLNAALTDADITFAYDPEVFYPAVPTGMLADRLGIYAYYGGQWHYVGGRVDTKAHTVSIDGLNLTDFPAGTQLAVLAMTTRFHDLPDAAYAAWFTQPVDAAIGHHVLYGYPDGTFRPGAPVTRAEFAAMLARALRLDASGAAKQTFTDVPASAWEFGTVEAAAQAGLVNGYPDGSFRPDRPITREELAAMVARALDYAKSHKGLWTKAMKVPDLTPPAWADAAQVGAWAHDAVTAAARAGIVQGYPDGSFRPQADATRAETAAMVARLIADLGI